MISFSNRVVIAADPSDVFAYLGDPVRIPEWNYFVEQVTALDDHGPRSGSRYHQRRASDEQIFELAEFEPPSRLVLRTLPDQRPAFTRTLVLTARPGGTGTELTDDWQLDTAQPPLVQQLARSTVRRAVRENLGKLTELIETGTTTLQDGRVITRTDATAARRS